MSAEYTATAQELTTLVGGVAAGAWEGTAAASYVAAHGPYVAWLLRAATNSAAMAAQQEITAAAYTAASAAMPTVGELVANHTIHAVLLGTNFFGINTIPIAVNEADYGRMWVQAATTMTTYQAVSTAAAVAAPPSDPAPQIVKTDATTSSQPYPGLPVPYPDPKNFGQLVADLQYFVTFGEQYLTNTNLTSLPQVEAFLQAYFQALTTVLPAELSYFLQHPSGLLGLLLVIGVFVGFVLRVLVVIKFLITFPQYLLVLIPIIAGPALLGALGGVAGLAGLSGLAALPVAPTGAESVPITAEPTTPVIGVSPITAPVVSPGPPAPASPTPAPAPVSASTPAPIPAVDTTAPPPPPTAPGGFPYLVGGLGIGSGISTSAGAKKKVPELDTAAAPAAATSTKRKAQARRRRGPHVSMLGRGHEYMDLDDDLDSEPGAAPDHQHTAAAMASDQGGGTLGSAGTAGTDGANAVGLTTLPADAFGGGPRTPMMPSVWERRADPRADPARGGTTPENPTARGDSV